MDQKDVMAIMDSNGYKMSAAPEMLIALEISVDLDKLELDDGNISSDHHILNKWLGSCSDKESPIDRILLLKDKYNELRDSAIKKAKNS